MPIVNSELWKWRDRGNGWLAIFETHTDHKGVVREYRSSRKVIPDLSKEEIEIILNQEMLARIPMHENELSIGELYSIQQQVENGIDPATIARNHTTRNQKAKSVAKALTKGSPRNLIKAALYIKGFSDTQIQGVLTYSQMLRIRARQNYILNNQDILVADIREEL